MATVLARPASPAASSSSCTTDSDAESFLPTPAFSPTYPARVRVRSESVSTIVQYSPPEDGEEDYTPQPGFSPINPASVQVTQKTVIDMTLSEWNAFSEPEADDGDCEDIPRLGPSSPALVEVTQKTIIDWIEGVALSQPPEVSLQSTSPCDAADGRAGVAFMIRMWRVSERGHLGSLSHASPYVYGWL